MRLWFVIALAGCGDDLTAFDGVGLVQVTSRSPFGACSKTVDGRPDFEVEPMLAVDPTDAAHLVVAWQQDRTATDGAGGIGVGASFDGGYTWHIAYPPGSSCTGRPVNGPVKTTDPWVTFGADGTVYLTMLSYWHFSQVLAFRSDDGGVIWDDPVPLIDDPPGSVFNDKDSVTGDPDDPDKIYAVWNRWTTWGEPIMPGSASIPTEFARTSADAWEEARPIFDLGTNSETVGDIVAVLPDGTLVNVATAITATYTDPTYTLQVVRSADKGVTWSSPVIAAPAEWVDPLADPHRPTMSLRAADGLPTIAVDRTTGALYVAWEDLAVAPGQHAIALVTSVDGGVTWSQAVKVNQGDVGFDPALAVADDGTVGLFYYQLDPDAMLATPMLATSVDRAASWNEVPLSNAFDLHEATFDTSYFVGDYQGLVTSGNSFVAAFTGATPDGTNIYVRPVPR